MKQILIAFYLVISILQLNAQIKVVCVGASITEGAGTENKKENSFPGQLQSLLGKDYSVENFGIGGTTMLRKGNYPYRNTEAYKKALQSNPDIVFIDLGGNDAKAVNRPYYAEMGQDCRDMIRSFISLPSKPRVIVLLPTAFFETDENQIWNPVSRNDVIPHLRKAAYEENVEVLDMYPLLAERPDLIPDNIHPNEIGAGYLAKRLFSQIVLPIEKDFDIFRYFTHEYKESEFMGYACTDFKLNGRDCKVVKPKLTAKGKPWIWRARFWAHEPQIDIALLERGFHLVYCDTSELMGNAEVIHLWNDFYSLLTNAGLSSKCVMEGMSRGAMYIFNWAAENPEKVAAVYVDNPLLDCRCLAEKEENQMISDLINAYSLGSQEKIRNFKGSPMDKTKDIAKGNYPILILSADKDEAVDHEQALLFEQKIKEAGGNITVITKHGFKHHPHSLPDPSPIVDFFLNAVSKDFYLSQRKYDSYKGLAMAGYQGWFSAPGDGSDRGWYHYWGKDGNFYPDNCSIDMWPDISEYDKVYKTEFQFADGSPAYVFSSYDESTVETHFRWMREYGIDGVFVQRFVEEIKRPKSYVQLNKVFKSAIRTANLNNRAISVMYDLSGMLPGDEQLVLKDIDYLESEYTMKTRKDNSSYLYHNGKPLVAVWGVGFNDKRKYGFKEAEIIIDALVEKGYSVLIGVPTHWRELTSDTMNDPELHRLIRKCDIVMPWFVGRYSEKTFSSYEKLVKKDIDWCAENKVDYAPLAFPGFSWVNMLKNSTPISRNKGSFYWRQLSSHIKNGAEMLYLAMFDEIDEGTAIFKCATEVPVGKSYFLPLDKDFGSDYYLWLAGEAGKMLRKERPFSDKKPERMR